MTETNTDKSSFSLRHTCFELLSGTASGIAQVLTGQPFDIVKVRLQTQSKQNPQYSGAMDCLKKIIKKEGFMGLYKGTLSPLVGTGFSNSIYFGANEALNRFSKHYFSYPDKYAQPLFLIFSNGFISGIFTGIISVPVELIRIQLQVQGQSGVKHFTGSGDAFKKIVKQFGVKGLYKGGVLGFTRECIGLGFYFASYEATRRILFGDKQKDAWYIPFFGGPVSGIFYWLSSYPVDVLKSKIQADNLFKPQFKNIRECIKYTNQHGRGISEYFLGFWPCMARAAFTNIVAFMAFERTLIFLRTQHYF